MLLLPVAVRMQAERRLGQIDAVVKGGAKAAEAEFYERIAPVLRGRGVGVPDLLWGGEDAGERWLIIEEIPTPLPRKRWGADPEVVAALARIHTAGDALPPLRAGDAFRPEWSEETTAMAIRALGDPNGDGLDDVATVLAGMQEDAAPLFAPACPLSGDPNPANWGLRSDGSLVLYDWERFCRGTPALDLAALVPGLGTPEDFEDVAASYAAVLTNAGEPTAASLDVAALARDSALAKAWNVVEVLAGIAAGQEGAGQMADWLRGAFPDWVRAWAR
jgi:aminoglycoside phosphotransferase (APT) family kinase protein